MHPLFDLWRREPARIVGFVSAVIMLLIAFNVPVTDEQKAAILAIVTAGLALLQAEVTRANVFAPQTVDRIEGEAFADGWDAKATDDALGVLRPAFAPFAPPAPMP